MAPLRGEPAMDGASGTSALRRSAAHRSPRGTGIGRTVFLNVVLAFHAGAHGPLEVNIIRRAFTNICAAEPSDLGAAGRGTRRVPISERTARRPAATILALEGFSRGPWRHRPLWRFGSIFALLSLCHHVPPCGKRRVGSRKPGNSSSEIESPHPR